MKDRVESGEGRKIYEGRKRGLQKRKKQNKREAKIGGGKGENKGMKKGS